MLRRQFLAALAPAPRPNILVLFTDDHRFNAIRALGDPQVQTPNLDKLIAAGTTYTHAFIMGGTIGAICAPSRGMLMTGRTLFHVDEAIIRPDARKAQPFHLVGEELRKAGYDTFHTGKWHIGPKLLNRCFAAGENIFFGGMDNHTGTKVCSYDPTGAYPKSAIRQPSTFSSELFADAAIGFLKSRAGSSAPFFCNVAFTSPHDPRTAPKRFADLYDPAKIQLPPNFLAQHPFDNGELKVRDEMLAPHPRPESEIRRHIADYYAMISEVDHQIGRILQTLDETGLAGNTLVIFAGDNGLAVGQHGLLGKQNPYDHSWRVPLVLRGPGVARGKRVTELRYMHDINATIYDATRTPMPASVEMKPLLRPGGGRARVFFAYRDIQRAVRDQRWKLVLYHVNGQETARLYDLSRDPWEMNPVDDANRIRHYRALLAEEMRAVGDPLDITKPNWGKAA